MRLKQVALFALPVLLAAPELRGEYVVLRSGQRLAVTGYQLVGDKYHLQVRGGVVEIPAEEVVTIEPEEVFTRIAAEPVVKPPYRELVEAAAVRYSVDADLITSVIAAESNFDPKAVSPRNAQGLMQLLPETAKLLGVQDVYDPRANIDGGTRYLRDLLQTFKGDLILALAAYNAGPDKVQKYGRVPPIAETISYVRRVKKNYDRSKQLTSPKATIPTATQAESSSPPRTSSAE